MKKFPMLNVIAQLFIALTVGLVEKIMILIYCLLPMGFFMLLMSLRSKNHKATAISTFTNENSEFQHIFPNYILVIIEPNLLKRSVAKKVNAFNNFVHKYMPLFFLCAFLLAIIGYIIWFSLS